MNFNSNLFSENSIRDTLIIILCMLTATLFVGIAIGKVL